MACLIFKHEINNVKFKSPSWPHYPVQYIYVYDRLPHSGAEKDGFSQCKRKLKYNITPQRRTDYNLLYDYNPEHASQ